MKRYVPHHIKGRVPSGRNSFGYKERKGKLKNNAGSTFMRIQILRPREESRKTELLKYGIVSYKKPKYDEYMVEFDNHQNSFPHFHLWRTNGYSKISDTRSSAISLSSNINDGIEYSYREREKEAKLNDIQSEQILDFICENRFLLFCMYNAFRQGKVKSFVGLDEHFVYRLFSKAEMSAIKQKYTLQIKQTDIPEFSK